MNSKDFLKEGFVEDAHMMHQDHEVQMAREELYHAAEDAIALHRLLRNVSEQQGLEGWVSSKITLAADYLKTVREYLEYELMSQNSSNKVTVVGNVLPIAEDSQDKTVKIVKRRGKPIGEIGIDPEASPGNGPYYVKLYDGSVDLSGYDTAEEALAELKYLVKQSVAEGLNEMDKTQTSPGRDGDIDWTKKQIHLGPEHVIKAKDIAKHAGKALDKAMKKSHPKTWHDVDSKLGQAVDKMSQAEKVKKGLAHPDTLKKQGVAEAAGDNPVANAIYRRLMLQKPDLFTRYGLEYVAQAVEDVADFVGDVEEIGSSDVSGWVRQVEQNLKDKINQYDEPMQDIDRLAEMSAGSVATVVNPPAKNKSKVGTLFGGTYKQKKTKA